MDRPLGWIQEHDIPTSGPIDEVMASAMSPLLDRRTTLKDALARLIEAEVQAGIVVDGKGGVLGLVTAEMIFDWSRRSAEAAEAKAAEAKATEAKAAPA
jgi:CBS domain-containing protein